MNITYMIGNGFDIALGLKTRYSDFVKHYCSIDKKDNSVLVRFQDVVRKDKCGLWSCEEKAFGEMNWSAFDGVNTVKVFQECLLDFQHEFEVYLKDQWKRFQLADGSKGLEIARAFFDRMFHVEKFMGNKFAREYRQFVSQHGRIGLSFIVYNYTDILEQLWALMPTRPNEGVRSFDITYNNTRMPVDVSCPCFVHGVFSRSKYLFGVDNLNQIKDEAIRSECERSGQLVKPYMDEDSGLGYDDRARELIEKSDVIVTYGISFGETDRIWWERLYQHVFNRGKRLIICPHYGSDRVVMNSGDAAMIDKQNEVRRVFSSLVGDEKYQLDFNRSRIKSVRLLDDFETEGANGRKIRCDYFGLHELAKATIKGE